MTDVDFSALPQFMEKLPEVEPEHTESSVESVWSYDYEFANGLVEEAVRSVPGYVVPESDAETWIGLWRDVGIRRSQVWEKFKRRPSKSPVTGSKFDNGTLYQILGECLVVYDGLRVSGLEYDGGPGTAIDCAGSIRYTLWQIRENTRFEQGL